MSVNFIPPKDPNEKRLEQIQNALEEVLRPYIKGRGNPKEERIKAAVAESIRAIRPLLKLARPTQHGATVMTEAAAAKNEAGNFTKGPKNL